METIKSLNTTDFDSIYIAFNEAFKDYEMQLNKNELHVMLNRRGFVPELSFGAFKKDKLIAFTLNGIGSYNNTKTAYDSGTGTIKEFRGQGLATKIFEYSLPFLKNANIENYLLEVLQHNTKAVSVYKNLGFQISREFNYFIQKADEIKIDDKQLNIEYEIRPIDLLTHEMNLYFCDFIPSWQNSFDAIGRKLDDFIILGVYHKQILVGYCIFEPKSGDITQIAVDKLYRRKGIGSFMLKEILKHNQHQRIKVINTQINCSSITSFMTSIGISLAGKQYEMIKKID